MGATSSINNNYKNYSNKIYKAIPCRKCCQKHYNNCDIQICKKCCKECIISYEETKIFQNENIKLLFCCYHFLNFVVINELKESITILNNLDVEIYTEIKNTISREKLLELNNGWMTEEDAENYAKRNRIDSTEFINNKKCISEYLSQKNKEYF
jgi:hypothetical protein